MTEPLDIRLRRLDEERAEADRRYNAALTALDQSLPALRDWPSPPAGFDDAQLAAINEEWKIIAGGPAAAGGWRGRLTGFIWRTVAPYLEKQLAFNARLVDHLNRQAAAAREARGAAEDAVARLREESAKLLDFHAKQLLLWQQVTAYVDTRDRHAGGGALVLNASLSGLAENVDKRWESQGSRDRRLDARTAALQAAQEEIRTIAGAAQQAALAVKRELERLSRRSASEGGQPPSESERGWGPASADKSRQRQELPTTTDVFTPLDAYKYVGFEDQFRGSREAIRARFESYLPFFAGTSDVVDVGCGRGEFLELLASAGIRARGLDLNHEMAELCRARGLDVTEADAVTYLSALPDASIGGLFSAQVVEHLQPGYLLRFLELAFHKLRPGGRLVLETLNPACWAAFFDSYLRDITHVCPLHPETLQYLVLASGFTRADLEFRSPVAAEDRLQTIALPAGDAPAQADLAEAFNANVEKLNARLFTFRDYAVIGTR